MKVLKFGGTSVGSSKNISKVIKIVKTESASENIVVDNYIVTLPYLAVPHDGCF